MADNTTLVPSATAQASADSSPTQNALETQGNNTFTNGALLSNEFLADLGLEVPVETKTSGDGESGKAQSFDEPLKGDEETEKAAHDEDEVPAEEKTDKVPDWVPKRLSKNAEQRTALRAEIATLKEAGEAKDAALAEAGANIPQLLPSSPLSHLTTQEALEGEAAKIASFMEQDQNPDFPSTFNDYDQETATSDRHEQWKKYALVFVKNQTGHAKALVAKEATRQEVRKNNPALFDVKSPEFKERIALHSSDPRTMPDYDQFIADALAGRKAREGMTTAAAATPKPKVTATVKSKESPPVYTLPPTTRTAFTPSTSPDAKQAAYAKARSGGVSIDDMEDAGALN